MISSVILAVLIGCYVAWVIRKKIRDIINGRYCGCGCDECGKFCASGKCE